MPSTTDGMGQFLQAGPISPQVTLERALAATKEQLSYYFTIEYKAETTPGGVRWDADSVTVGKFRAPDRFEEKGSTTFATSNETVTGGGESITIGATEYTKTPETGEWEVHTREPAVPIKTPLERMTGDPSLLSSLAFVAVEQLDGVDVLHLIAIVPPGVDIAGLADPRLDRRVEYWIGRDDHLIRKYVFAGESPDEGGFTFTVTLSNFGEPVEISAPEASNLAVSGYMVSAQEEEPLRLTGTDVIDFDHDEIFVIQDAVRTISRGEKVGDGCKFTTRLDRAFGEAPKVSRTLAVNLATCEELREEGTLSPGDLEKNHYHEG